MSTESTTTPPIIESGGVSKLVARVLADCFAVSVVVAFWIVLLRGQLLADELVVVLAQVWIYTILISTAAHLILPPVYPLIAHRPVLVQWALLVAALAAIGVAGSVLGSIVVAALSVEPDMTFSALFWRSASIAVLLAALIGVVHAKMIFLRERLSATEQELRTQEAEYERALKLAAEARLAALEARIHPHFLFNTLNTVSSLIPTAPERAERLIGRMSAVLRFSLEAPQTGLVALRQEMKIVQDYLEIEQARFGPRLRFTINVDDRVGDSQVPPLSVQTLVENSVKHAIGPSRDGAQIDIRAFAEGDRVRVEVADTGPGFSIADAPAGHGIDNLRGRLALLFGESEPMRAAHSAGWTTVSFCVPA